jgi:RHS repeat-associated protein
LGFCSLLGEAHKRSIQTADFSKSEIRACAVAGSLGLCHGRGCETARAPSIISTRRSHCDFAGSAIYLAGARHYAPDEARWINRDPIGQAGGINVYSYAGNNPINKVDPCQTPCKSEPFHALKN